MAEGEEADAEAEIGEEKRIREYFNHLRLYRRVKISGCLLTSLVRLTRLVLDRLRGPVHVE